MVSKYDLINYVKKGKIDNLTYDEETDTVTRKSDNAKINMDLLLDSYRKKTGQSFDTIYDFHAYNMEIIKCTECGTVIRNYYDENYDPNLKCPTCTNYHTDFEYWTKEQIDDDPEVRVIIDMYQDMAKRGVEQYKRIQARGGLQDWELAKKTIHFNNVRYTINLDVFNVTNINKLSGLNLKIQKLDKDGNGWVCRKIITIPLSPSQLYYQLFYKYYLKRHPEKDPFEQLKGRPLYESMEENEKLILTKKVPR